MDISTIDIFGSTQCSFGDPPWQWVVPMQTGQPYMQNCQHCGGNHNGSTCWRIKSIEYNDNGTIKRIEYQDDK